MKQREEAEVISKHKESRTERAAGKTEARAERIRRNRAKGGVFPKKVPYAVLVLLMGVASAVLLGAMILVNAFPTDLTLIIIAIILGLLSLASVLMARKDRWKRIVGLLIAVIFVAVVGGLSYYLYSTYAMMNRISGNENFSNAEKAGGAALDPTQEPFNVYITGIDQWEDEKGLDLERSDVNMIVTVNPKTKKILLTSIPRDSYVKLHTAQQMDKLTHTGVYGVDETLNTVEDWLGIDLDYYIKMNFSAAVEIIDAIGGIKVYSPVAFESSLKGYKYKQGWNYLGGYKALYFARERHAFEGQDSIRVENQQRVIKAMIRKMTSSKVLLTRYGDIMAAAGSNLHTDMSYDEIRALVRMQMSDLAEWDVQSQKIEGEYDMDYVASLSQKNKYSVYRPDAESVRGCIEKIDSVMNPSQEELDKAEEKLKKGFLINMMDRIINRSEEEEDV